MSAPRVFHFTTQRVLEVIADTEDEARRLVAAQMDDDETILSVEDAGEASHDR